MCSSSGHCPPSASSYSTARLPSRSPYLSASGRTSRAVEIVLANCKESEFSRSNAKTGAGRRVFQAGRVRMFKFIGPALVLATVSTGQSAEYIKKTNLFVPDSGGLENHNGSMNMQDQTVHCGPSSYVSGIQAVGTDGSSMGMYLRYICRSIDGKNLTVKKTNPVVPDTGSRINGSNYGVSEPADGPIAGCPQGSY
jgi:hypothetical protein